jgi:hypothetical protein
MKRILILTLFIGIISLPLLGNTQQNKLPTSNSTKEKITTNEKKSVREILVPAKINYGSSTVVGDVEVMAVLGTLVHISDEYKAEEKVLQNKYEPSWQQAQTEINNAIKKVKEANKWGDDVIFDFDTKQWVRLTPDEVKSLNKQKDVINK